MDNSNGKAKQNAEWSARYDSFFAVDGEITTPVATIDRNLSERYFNVGVEDGMAGQKNAGMLDQVRQSASSFQSITSSKLMGMLKKLDEKMARLREEVAHLREETERVDRYRQLVRANQKYLPKLFMKYSAILYGAVGLFLLVADASLSWQVAGRIFDSLPKAGRILIPFISIGLSLLSFYVKVFYDQVIGVPDGVSRIRYKEIRQLTGDRSDWRLIAEQFFKLLFNLAVFGAVLLIFVFLAYSRLSAIDGKNVMMANNINAKWLFILINVFMPLVAGICFSIAQKTLINRKALIGLDAEIEGKRQILEQRSQEIARVEQDHAELDAILHEWVLKQDFVSQYANHFILAYDQGFQKGFSSPDDQDRGMSLVLRVDAYRNRMFARKIRSILNTMP
jgi:hypothetical protein